jgi:hypothetical protein
MNRKKSVPWLLLCTLIALIANAHGDDGAGAGAKVADIARFLDPATATAQRHEIFSEWHRLALAGDVDAQYVAGSLYRRGDDIQPAVVARNDDLARRYLSTAAASGRVLAMAKMAELELADNHPLDAMIWAQVYGYYRGWVGNTVGNPSGSDKQAGASVTTYFDREYDTHGKPRPSIYFEDLLQRAQKKMADTQTPIVLQHVNDFIVAHDKDVRAHFVRDGLSSAWKDEKIQFVNDKPVHGAQVNPLNSVSEWIMEFAADGSVQSARLFDAIPDAVAAHGHHGLVVQLRANAAASGHAPRYLLHTEQWKRGLRIGEAP